jgi:hypothetical protein
MVVVVEVEVRTWVVVVVGLFVVPGDPVGGVVEFELLTVVSPGQPPLAPSFTKRPPREFSISSTSWRLLEPEFSAAGDDPSATK